MDTPKVAGFALLGKRMPSDKKRYKKPPLPFEKQAGLLIQRGLLADIEELTDFLRRTNYYRFSTYLYPFRQPGSDDFTSGTRFSQVRELYNFDHELRMLVFGAIAELEIAILRTQFVEFFTKRYGAFGYTDPKNFRMGEDAHERLLKRVLHAVDRSRKQEEFIQHFRQKYADEYPPLWIAVEIMGFGDVLLLAQNMKHSDSKTFVRHYEVKPPVMMSWLGTLRYIGNTCAHHARLWNRALAVKPQIPHERNRPEFHNPKFPNSRVFAVLTIIQYLLNVIEPAHTWDDDLLALLGQYPAVPLNKMGFPPDWRALPMWCK